MSEYIDRLSCMKIATRTEISCELQLTFNGQLYTVRQSISKSRLNCIEFDAWEYLQNKCLYELFKITPLNAKDFVQNQIKFVLS